MAPIQAENVTNPAPDAIFRPQPGFAMNEEDLPKKKRAHEIGQDLSLLSVTELDERIALLKDEIARLESARSAKHASRTAADRFFKS
jgi:uncharacterized small protein (DUF1192 family)